MLKNNKRSYGLISILLHWISVLAVFGLFGVGWYMVELNYYNEWYRTLPHWHKSIGLLFMVLTLGRLVWKVFSVSPESVGSHIEKTAAKIAHAVLYLSLFVLFVSGYLISTADGRGIDIFNWVTVPGLGEFFEAQEDIAGVIHEYVAYALVAIVLLHALAALKHHFIDKDRTLLRMLRPG